MIGGGEASEGTVFQTSYSNPRSLDLVGARARRATRGCWAPRS